MGNLTPKTGDNVGKLMKKLVNLETLDLKKHKYIYIFFLYTKLLYNRCGYIGDDAKDGLKLFAEGISSMNKLKRVIMAYEG